jgi:hypothetical protein
MALYHKRRERKSFQNLSITSYGETIIECLPETLNFRYDFGHPVVDGSKIPSWIVRDVRVWIGVMWLKMEK